MWEILKSNISYVNVCISRIILINVRNAWTTLQVHGTNDRKWWFLWTVGLGMCLFLAFSWFFPLVLSHPRRRKLEQSVERCATQLGLYFASSSVELSSAILQFRLPIVLDFMQTTPSKPKITQWQRALNSLGSVPGLPHTPNKSFNYSLTKLCL